MEFVLDVFRNRPGKSIGSCIILILSLVTLTMFQNLKVETLSGFFNYLSNGKDNSTLLLTWGFNLFTFMLLVSMGVVWIKDVVKENYMDISPEVGRIISGIIGILHLVYSILFLSYIFSNLLGIVLAVLICILVLGTSNRR